MVKHSLRQLIANKARLISMALAIVLSVAFVGASFMLGDGLRGTLGLWSDQATTGFDLEVLGETSGGTPDPVDDKVRQQLLDVDGVAKAQLQLYHGGIEPMSSTGDSDPNAGVDWSAIGWNDQNGFTIVDGDAPTAAGQFVLDIVTSEQSGYIVGQSYDVTTPTGVRSMELTGLMQTGTVKRPLIFPTIALETESMRNVIDQPDYEDVRISIDSGADVNQVKVAVAEVVGGRSVRTAAEVEASIQDNEGQVITWFQNILLGFGALSVFVSAFVIYNTFNVVLGQRTRELGLMRAVGASPKQLKRAMRVEALLVGALSSVVGIVVGIGLNQGLVKLLDAIGAGLPESELVVAPRTIIICLLVGIVVTVVAASGPARKACAVPPIAAIREGATNQTPTKKRMIIGGLVAVVGIVLGGAGLTGLGSVSATIAAMAGGGAAVFIGVAMLSPLGVDSVISVLGWPLRRFVGVAGNLAQGNTRRNPQRSATTASALMIGLALISMVLVIGQSVKNATSSQTRQAFQGDYVLGDPGELASVDAEIVDDLKALDEVDQAVGMADSLVEIGDDELFLAVTNLNGLPELIDIQVVEGVGFSDSTTDPILVTQEEATKKGIGVGDVIPATLDGGHERDFTVIGLYKNAAGVQFYNYLIDTKTVADIVDEPFVIQTVLSATDGTSDQAFRTAINEVLDDYPEGVGVWTVDEYVAEIDSQIDQLLVIVNAMMLLAVVIAILGIANTLALSIFERTTEIGLLRAVGMKRRQLRRMIRYEAILLSLFGALLGILLGIGFGAASVAALPASIAIFSLPVVNISLLVAGAGIAGLLAAVLPARRASKMNPLDAIAG